MMMIKMKLNFDNNYFIKIFFYFLILLEINYYYYFNYIYL